MICKAPVHHLAGASFSATTTIKTKNQTKNPTAPTFFICFLLVNFFSVRLCSPPPQAIPGSLQQSLFALFLKSPFPGRWAARARGHAAARGVGTALLSLQPPAARPGCGFDHRLRGRGQVSEALSGVSEEKDHCHRAAKSPSKSGRAKLSAEPAPRCATSALRSQRAGGG